MTTELLFDCFPLLYYIILYFILLYYVILYYNTLHLLGKKLSPGSSSAMGCHSVHRGGHPLFLLMVNGDEFPQDLSNPSLFTRSPDDQLYILIQLCLPRHSMISHCSSVLLLYQVKGLLSVEKVTCYPGNGLWACLSGIRGHNPCDQSL